MSHTRYLFGVVSTRSGAIFRAVLGFSRHVVWLLAFAAASAPAWGGSPRAEHVFLISIDGGKPAVIAQSKMPTLKQLAYEGACTWRATTIFPCVTLPSHASMLTGVSPAKHKIFWNVWKPKAGVVDVPTVFSEAKKAGYSTAMFVGKEKFRHLAVPGSVDCFHYNCEQSREVIKPVLASDRMEKSETVPARIVAQDAARYIRERTPSLCFIHFTDPDDIGHKYGWGSREQINAFEDVDEALGMVLQALEAANITSESVVIVTADHGGHGKTHGLNIPADMEIPWIVWGRGAKRGFTITQPVATFDTAVTALWLLGVPRLDSIDGHVIDSAFEFHPASKAGG